MSVYGNEWKRKRMRDLALFGIVFALVAGVFGYRFFQIPQLEGSAVAGAFVTEEKPLFTAVAAYPFLADLLRQIGGPFVRVELIPAQAGSGGVVGVSAEQYDALQSADVVFLLDERKDAWMAPLAGNNSSVRVVKLREGADPLDENARYLSKRDRSREYYWLSPEDMKSVTRYIARVFGEMDGVHKIQYLDNAYGITYQLDDLKYAYQDALQGSKAVYSSVGYGYMPLLDVYDLKLGTVLSDSGPVQASVQAVQKRLRDHPQEYMLADVSFPISSQEGSGSVSQRMLFLDPYGQLFTELSYVDFLEENMRRLE